MQGVSDHFVGISGGMFLSVISFSVVFLVCGGLVPMMMSLKYFSDLFEKADKAKAGGAESGAKPTQPQSPIPQVSAESEEELIAVITAAIAASCGSGAKILSVTPVKAQKASIWRMTGRLQNFERA